MTDSGNNKVVKVLTGSIGPTGPAGPASTVTGPTGPTGPTGAASTVTGPTGPAGDPSGEDELYSFSATTTESDPGAGLVRFNHATMSSVTKAFIDNLNHVGVDVSAWLSSTDDSTSSPNKAVITFCRRNSPTTNFAKFYLTSVDSPSGYKTFNLTYITHGGSLDTTASNLLIRVSRIGDTGGPTGPTGATGPIGPTGPAGSGSGTAFAPETTMLASTSALVIPRGTSAQRPTAVNGMLRYNTTSSKVECYENGAWVDVRQGAAGTFFGMPIFNPTDNTGATDVTQQLLDFMLLHNGKTIFMPAGTPKIQVDCFGIAGTAPNGAQTTFKLFAIPGTVKLKHTIGKAAIRWIARQQTGFGDYDRTILAFALADLSSGTGDDQVTRVQVADASEFKVGKWVMVRSNNEPLQDGASGDIMDSYAECARVAKVDTVNDYVFLDRRLYLTYTSEGGIEPSILQLPDTEFQLYGIDFDSFDDNYDTTSGTRVDTLEVRGTPNAIISDCNMRRGYRAAFVLRTAPGALIRDCTVDYYPNNTSGSKLGYGYNIMCSSADVIVENCSAFRTRHGATTGGAVEPTRVSFYERWDQMGFPTNCLFVNFKAYGCNGSAVDAHAEGIGMTFKNINVQFPNRGIGSQDSQARGGYFRCGDVTIQGWTQIGGSRGLDFSTRVGYLNHKIRHKIQGAVITNLRHRTDDARGISIEDDNVNGLGTAHYREYTFTDIQLDDMDKGVVWNGDGNVIINGITMERIKNAAFQPLSGAKLLLKNAMVSYRGMSSGSATVFLATSAQALVVADLTVHCGEANGLPLRIFSGSGNYYIAPNNYLEYNPNSITQPVMNNGLTALTTPIVRVV